MTRDPKSDRFYENMKKDIKDENRDHDKYNKQSKDAPNKRDRQTVRRIARDEKRHAKIEKEIIKRRVP